MKTTLLGVPSKTTKDVTWIKPLNRYLLSVYGDTTEFQQDLAQFDKLRQDSRGTGNDFTTVKLNFEYFSKLELLDLRIPISSLKSKSLVFVWCDAFQPSVEHQQHSLAFEKASVLFNLGSLMCKLAISKYSEAQRSSSDDNGAFKEAVQLFQQAAGVFQFLATNFLHPPSNDLQPDTVKFLSDLCIAQSQEIFTLKVIDGDLAQTKNSLISKLCRSTAKHYEECFGACSNNIEDEGSGKSKQPDFAVVDSLVDDDDESSIEVDFQESGGSANAVRAELKGFWIATIQFKMIYYRSLSFYFQGLQLEATNKYGEAIAFLKKSVEILEDIDSSVLRNISKEGGEDAYELLDNFKYHKDALGIKLTDLNKDNDLIYHDIVPSLVTLPEPKPMNSTTVIPMNKVETFNQISEYNYNNFLKNVVPVNIHEMLSFYSEEKSQLLRNEIDEVDVSNEELLSILEHLKLPKALVNIKQSVSHNNSSEHEYLLPEIHAKVNEIAGKYEQDIRNRDLISHLRNRILQFVSSSESLLGSQMSHTSEQLREDLIKLKKSLYDAANSDQRLFALIDSNNSGLYQILGRGPESAEFQTLFNTHRQTAKPQTYKEEISLLDMDDSQIAENSNTIERQITSLENLLNDLNKIKVSKMQLVNKLKEEIHNDDISDILMLNIQVKSSNEIKTIIFPEELKKFDKFSQELDSIISRQLSLITELKNKWDGLTAHPEVRELQKSRTVQEETQTQQLARIARFYDEIWRKYSSGLKRGVEFYTQLAGYAENVFKRVEKTASNGLEHSMQNMSLERAYTGNSNESFGDASARPALQETRYSSGSQHAFAQLQVRQQHSGQSQGQYFEQMQQQNTAQRRGTDEAPALPPKRPSQSQFPNTFMEKQTFHEPKTTSDLIYDQPSIYKPDMYNFFLKQG